MYLVGSRDDALGDEDLVHGHGGFAGNFGTGELHDHVFAVHEDHLPASCFLACKGCLAEGSRNVVAECKLQIVHRLLGGTVASLKVAAKGFRSYASDFGYIGSTEVTITLAAADQRGEFFELAKILFGSFFARSSAFSARFAALTAHASSRLTERVLLN